MKLRMLSVRSLFLTVVLGAAGPLLAQNTYGPAPVQPPPPPTVTPTDTAKPEIEGVPIQRDKGDKKIGEKGDGFLGLEVDGNGNFKLTFYDKDKKPIAPDVATASIRWLPLGKKGILYTLLTPSGDGQSLLSPKAIEKPWTFTLSVLLFASGDASAPVESYSVDYSE
ncbi:MAG: hypothetical protein ABSE59_06455 [Opitutaceae bacterium]|jgi:hypothetical protein